VPEPVRQATEYDYREQIRRHLGYRAFTEGDKNALVEWVQTELCDDFVPPAQQLTQAEEYLRAQRIVLPAPGQLRRLLVSAFSQGQQALYERIAGRLSDAQRQAIEDEHTFAALTEFKRSPAEPSVKQMRKLIDRHERLAQLGIPDLDLSGVNPDSLQRLSQLARCYDARAFRRIEPSAKRYALLSCFLFEATKTLLDHIVEMNDRLLTAAERTARHRFEEKHRKVRRRARRGLSMAVTTLEALLNEEQPQQVSVSEFLDKIGFEVVRQAVHDCRALEDCEQQGLVAEIDRKYNNLRKYTPRFFRLDFGAVPGAEPLLKAIRLLHELNDGQRTRLPDDAPVGFIPGAWQTTLYDQDGNLSRRAWELGVYFETKRALRSGQLYLTHSRRHRDFWEMVYSQRDWQEAKPKAYSVLQLPNQFDEVLQRLCKEFEKSVALAKGNLGPDGFAWINPRGALKLRKDDALEVTPSVKALKERIDAHMPLVRIEKLLAAVDHWSEFTHAFKPLSGYEIRGEVLLSHLLAALIAHGTNVGLFGMGHSSDSVTVDQLRHTSRWLIREQTLNAASAQLIDSHRPYPISQVWGDGRRSSSDGQRFGIEVGSLLASYYPRYFGHYDKAITIYTHQSDQCSVFSTQIISCHVREALYVLDGLLSNITTLEPTFHSTDTAGYTEHLFGLCFLLRFSFQPRLADLPRQQLYKIAKEDHYSDLDVLFNGAVDVELVREQWDQLVRVAASLKNGIAPAHVILDRLAGRAPSDKVAKALAALGQLIKTTYIRRYVADPALRYRVQLQLNRGESRHQLAKHVFFANRGVFRTNDLAEIMNKATCLSLLSNAVLVWNTHHIEQTVQVLRAQGYPVDDNDLARISPLAFRNMLVHGTYDFSDIDRLG
jgi:TnpA family transposase